jgi:5-methylcytosine-specific restriction endonuclease McrA
MTRPQIDYSEYIKSDAWIKKRSWVLVFWDHRCALCYREANHVHHRTYDRLGDEKITDLILLCEDCHNKYHNRIRH